MKLRQLSVEILAQTRKKLVWLFEKLIEAQYHEYSIKDRKGRIIGYEIITLRGGYSLHLDL